MKRKFFIWSVVLGIFIGVISSIGIADLIHYTGSDKFCTMCHTMEPMVKSYHNDVHGGNNKLGVKAECSACHLSHDNTLMYLWTKTKVSLNDGYKTVFTDVSKIDWHKKRDHAHKFTYDSGCMTCHSNLQEMNNQVDKAWLAHRDYFAGHIDKTCVQCHNNVGHKNMGIEIKKHWENINANNK